MFSSLLPKPKHCSHETIKVVLPKPTGAFNALIVPSSGTENDPKMIQLAHSGKKLSQIHVDETGVADIGRTIASASGNTAVQLSYEDTVPLKVKYPNLRHHFPRYTLETCPDDSLAVCVAETRKFIDDLLLKSQGGDAPGPEPTLVTYTPNSLSDGDNRGRTLEIRNYKEDPLLPPKFKLRKNRENEPSPPPPILKSAPTEKITKDVKDKWHIPSAVSNWKNNQGFAISLDKRVHAASGGSSAQGPDLNIEKFTALSLALESADKQAREELALRNEHRKQLAIREQAEKEKQLKALLDKSRQAKRNIDYDHDHTRKRYRGS